MTRRAETTLRPAARAGAAPSVGPAAGDGTDPRPDAGMPTPAAAAVSDPGAASPLPRPAEPTRPDPPRPNPPRPNPPHRAPLRPLPPRPVTLGKLRPPRLMADHVARAALAARVCAPGGPALIRAPSGFGKTTFMAEMREHLSATGLACAWLTLDAADNDALQLAVSLDAALDDIGLDRDAPAPPPSEAAGRGFALLDRAARLTGPFALFLDDFEAIREDAALSLVKELIQALPPGARLVVGSRTPPALGLARLRARGALMEADAADLRFSEADAHAFLARRCKLPLTHAELMGLHRKTEGWPAALRLAAVALERRSRASDFVTRFTGSEGAVADYLAEDVLAGQPPERLDFLLRTSILRQLDPDLCDALHPPGGSAEILETLASGNILLSPAEGKERSYRYHSLFADFLRDRLERRMPGAAPALHAAAARWYAEAGRPASAIDHCVEGGDAEGAAFLLERHARGYLEQGRVRLLARWFEALPDAALDSRPGLRLVRIWTACFTRAPQDTLAMLEASALEASDDPALRAEARAVRPLLLSMIDDYPGAYAAGRLALDDQPLRSRYAAGVLANCMTNVFTVVGAVDEARANLARARRATSPDAAPQEPPEPGANAFNIMYAEATEGIIDLNEGRCRDAAARFRLALAASGKTGAGRADGNGYAALLHAVAVYEANDLRQAAHLLHLHLPMARDVGLLDHLIQGHVMLSRIAFEDGELDEAYDLLGELEHLGHRRALPRAAASARLERARALMNRGQSEAAREQVALAGDPAVWDRARGLHYRANDLLYPELSSLRLDLAEGRGAEALPRLRQEIAAARADRRLRRAGALRLLEGAALHQAGAPHDAARVLREVLSEAAREGLMRLILDEGAPVAEAIRAAVPTISPADAPLAPDPHFRSWLQDLTAALPQPVPVPAPAPVPANRSAAESGAGRGLAAPLDALTQKETQILALLAEGYSNAAMAAKLCVSDSTVRTHLRNINSKLDASSRTQAVAVGRRLGLIG